MNNTDHIRLKLSEPTERDSIILKWQLNTDTLFVSRIVERCGYGFPRIVLLRPLTEKEDGKRRIEYTAVANPLWLTCPYLNDRIHELENRGYISKISEFINNDPGLKRKMATAHAHFYYLRKKNYQRFVNDSFPIEKYDMFNRGIGGVEDTGAVKCLHLQFAHYRIFKHNMAGKITCNLLHDRIDCDEARCRYAIERK